MRNKQPLRLSHIPPDAVQTQTPACATLAGGCTHAQRPGESCRRTHARVHQLLTASQDSDTATSICQKHSCCWRQSLLPCSPHINQPPAVDQEQGGLWRCAAGAHVPAACAHRPAGTQSRSLLPSRLSQPSSLASCDNSSKQGTTQAGVRAQQTRQAADGPALQLPGERASIPRSTGDARNTHWVCWRQPSMSCQLEACISNVAEEQSQ